MQKPYSFLQCVMNKKGICILAFCLLLFVLVYNTDNAGAEDKVPSKQKTISIVYAQGKTTASSAEVIEETAEDAQIRFDNEEPMVLEQLEESVAAMQSDLALEIANQEKTRRELEKKKIHLSKTDTQILYRIVEAEATGEDIAGKKLVANVILNRVNSEEFPDTVEEVVFAHRQFSPIRDGRYYKVEITKETKKAVQAVLAGEDNSKGALYFMSRKYADASNVRWFDSALTKVTEHGTHEFFK